MTRAALVVGINTYTYFQDLKAPSHDAEEIAQRLQKDGEFKVTRLPEAITQDCGQNTPIIGKTLAISQIQLETALKQLFLPKSHQRPKTALFYFSGHGLRDEEGDDGLDKGYLVTSDTDPHKSRPGLSLAWLQNLLKRSQIQQQIVWLDCCHSGSFLINIEAANPGQSPNRDRCFIASSRSFAKSWQDLNSPYSVLTKALLDGLNPKVHVVSDDWIDTFALTTYVKQSLRKEQQTPVCTNFGTPIPLIRVDSESVIFPGVNDDAICPYKGLEYFEFNDEDPKYFFGREQLIDELLDQVRMKNFVALIGASGSGKSSVLFAGLLHQLSLGQRVVGSDQWQIYVTRPDQHPLQNLALAFVEEGLSDLKQDEARRHASDLISKGASGLQSLVQKSPAPKVILVIDQFEEVFTRCADSKEREQFLACIMGALAKTGNKLRLIIAMRADFVGKCLEQEYSGLAQQLTLGTVNVLPMTEDELIAAIRKPAAQVGLAVDDALVTQILADINGEPGSLPLLQYTLKTLWQECKGNRLLFSTYRSLGGINGTLDKRATEIYQGFDPAQQRTVQHIFQQLTQLGEGTADTRRRVFLDNLNSEPQHPAEQVKQVIEILANRENRLLVTNEVVRKDGRHPVVDVAHEALISHWRLLKQWIEQDRDLLRQQRRIETNAVTWQEHNQAKGYLLQGFLLKEALRFQKQQSETLPLSGSARNFLKRSLWQRRWDQLKIASLTVLLVPTAIDYALHRQEVEQHYTKLNGADKAVERESVLFLTQHCLQRQGKLTGYIIERTINQYCRSLANRTFTDGANLSGVNLLYATLSNADLSDANLNGANFNITDLRRADLRRADLREATLNGADLRNTKLSDADLREATLIEANLTNAILFEADLRNADLSDADLREATLSAVDFFGANLFTANISNATLIYATLTNANLSYANLSGADLKSANLWGADLRYATLKDADLLEADLTTANLSSANLDNANLSGAILEHAYLSGGFTANSVGANLSGANLSEANVYSANLVGANLSEADLSYASLVEADLSKADLSNADLSGAFLAATDLRSAENLTSDQLTGEDQPYLCNVALPNYITGIDPNRDCSRLPQVLVNRYGLTIEYAEQLVQRIRAYQFHVLD
ncbi:MAG: pentapeptide repeat-containing protein [Cyanobacteria bacterium P01_A01_bin.123]